MAAAGGGEEAAAATAAAEPGEEDRVLPSEVEVLESIYLDELQVSKGNDRSDPWEISITLHPATADDQDSQYVCFVLVLSVPVQYPNEVPKITIRNPRGLSDEQIGKISQTLRSLTKARLGTPMLYELIEENEAFTKTPCYHYFHSYCLASYTQHMEEEKCAQRKERLQTLAPLPKEEDDVPCPVCRGPLVYDLETLQTAPPPQQPMEVYQPDTQTLLHREQLHLIYQRQQAKGGIINPEAERNRYFISLQKSSGDPQYEHGTITENAMDAEKELPPADSEHPQGMINTVPVRNESDKIARPPITFHHHSKRERTRGEKSSLRGPGLQLHFKTVEMPEEMRTSVEGESRAFSRRPNWRKERGQWSCGKYSQNFPKSCSKDQVSFQMDKKELCTSDISTVKEELCLREKKNAVGKWESVQKTEAQDREKDDIEASHSELREPAGWQGQRGMQNCRRWEKSKNREHGTYPKMSRCQGQSRPNLRREPHGQQAEGGS
ncbi:E3 ubiquitin-protein ligase RNF25 isoform X2 [Sceloporus undulatus]|uniref:E3 ubiquitin-protein ligase RNF25 isoform X2 n=1 Tax=Sceloporus undulatus TaxID=8520 RepID=UPI001C4BE9F5|nr:E3 ubiquitin-protein ligase RNF25 isoform X2 [Sceloporus undulatus]